MALVIETGALVAGANSYVTLAEARAFASARGVTLSAVDATLEPLVVNACDYLQSLEARYKGIRVSDTQALAWPRRNVYMYSFETAFSYTAIPSQLKNAQCQLTIDAMTVDLQPRGSGKMVINSTVGPISTTYASTGLGASQPVLVKANAILQPLLKTGFGAVIVDRA